MARVFFISLAALVAIAAVHAACPVTVQSKNTQDLLNEIPSLNTDLQSCPTALPSSANRFAGNGNVLFVVAMNDGTTQNICVQTANNQATGASVGTCSAASTIRITEGNLDGVLQSTSRSQALSRLFLSGQITVRPASLLNRLTLFFAKPFIKSAVKKNAPATLYRGPPEHCDETMMQGHQGYSYAKALWDSYSADTDGVCQMQQGYMPDGHCIYGVQQSSQALIPYYLCWYRN